MNKSIALSAIATLALAVSGVANGAEDGATYFVGVGAGQSSAEVDDLLKDSDTAYRVFAGFNINRYFSSELAYFDAGTAEERIGSAVVDLEASGVIFSFRGTWPIGDKFAIYGKVGGALYDIDLEARQGNQTLIGPDGTEEDVTYGAGVEFNLAGSFALRLEYEAFVVSDGDLNLATLNALFKF